VNASEGDVYVLHFHAQSAICKRQGRPSVKSCEFGAGSTC